MKKLILVIALAVSLSACGVNNEVKEYDKENVVKNNVFNIKQLVYDADYTVKELEGKSYMGTNDKVQSLDNIVLPYINIDSEDGKKANKEIEGLFNELAQRFASELKHSEKDGFPGGYLNMDYYTYINDNILSVFIEMEEGYSSETVPKYYTCNFDLTTLKRLDIYEVAKSLGINNIDEIVEEKIKSKDGLGVDESFLTQHNIQTSISNYKEAIKNKTSFYIDGIGRLNVAVLLEVPEIDTGLRSVVFTIDDKVLDNENKKLRYNIQKYFDLVGAERCSPDSILSDLGFDYVSGLHESDVKGYLNTGIKYEEFKKEMLKYVSEEWFETRFEDRENYKNVDGILYVLDGGSSGVIFKVRNVKHISDSNYEVEVYVKSAEAKASLVTTSLSLEPHTFLITSSKY